MRAFWMLMGGGMPAVLGSATLASVSIHTVAIGHLGNAADDTGYGSVSYAYRMGTYEITAAQYTEFLNAVAATDTYALYNASMASTVKGCKIQRTGSSGSYTYSIAPEYANRPANYVSWGDAVRFANWMHNGQPSGPQGLSTTEDGSYFLNGVADSALSGVVRSAGATWVVPSEDEWYKAAYHKNDGVTGNFWEYATGFDTLPGKDLADLLGNNANFGPNPGSAIDGGVYWTTTVGEFQNSASAYGAFDMSGNINEWTEAKPATGNTRYLRGGSWVSNGASLTAASRTTSASGGSSQDSIGFRLAYIPSPSTAVIVVAGTLVAFRRRR